MLFLIPAYLSDKTSIEQFAPSIKEVIMNLNNFFVENEKTARRVIKFFAPEKKQSELHLFLLNKYTESKDLIDAQELMKNGEDFGLLSEAGLPCIADPGNIMVSWAHQHDIRVVPINGPSSIILALIASGFNGQQFTFNGYLPIDKEERRKHILSLEATVKKTDYTQIFMETPYRNNQLLADLLKILSNSTMLSISANINDPNSEYIKTQSVANWKKTEVNLHKQPAIFIIGN